MNDRMDAVEDSDCDCDGARWTVDVDEDVIVACLLSLGPNSELQKCDMLT